MSYSQTITDTTTFTYTHARHLAAKVATDLKRIQRFHRQPSDSCISDFELEVVELLRAGYLGEVKYGFQRNGRWIEPTLHYTARDLAGASSTNDAPGRIFPRGDVDGADFCSFLTYSFAWYSLTETEKREFEGSLPIQRTAGIDPGINGYWVRDQTYSAGGRALDRASIRSW